jgi:hypothetical protein
MTVDVDDPFNNIAAWSKDSMVWQKLRGLGA